MTPKSAHLRRLRHPAGMSASSVPTIVPGPRTLLATTGAGRLGAHRTTGAVALAPVFPLALTEPSLATARDTGAPPASRPASDRSGLWLRNDAAGLVFACLGIALALHGRRALRARTLNLAAVGASVFMNAIAAEPGWRNLAIWAMPPVAYALASDTLISVVRAWALAATSTSPPPLPLTRPPR